MFEVEVQNEADYALDPTDLVAAATQVLTSHEVEAGSGMTIVITDDDSVADLNRQFRGIDAPTDVLSFPMDSMPGDAPYLGDLVIAYPYASAQAAQEGHALADSLKLLVVHGTLHLLGYDHGDADERAEMWAAQEAALIALGVSPEIVPALENGVHDEPEG